MYIYFLPLSASSESPSASNGNGNGISSLTFGTTTETLIPIPTSDGGIEHTAAKFLPASTWLSLARSGSIILFPPQFLLLTLTSQFLTPNPNATFPPTIQELSAQRSAFLDFVNSGDPPWTEKCISPQGIMFRKQDQRAVLALDTPGPEAEGLGRRGDEERVVLVKFSKEGPRDVEVRWRKDVLAEKDPEGGEESRKGLKEILIRRGSGEVVEETEWEKAKL
jgi:hypothetical protein